MSGIGGAGGGGGACGLCIGEAWGPGDRLFMFDVLTLIKPIESKWTSVDFGDRVFDLWKKEII